MTNKEQLAAIAMDLVRIALGLHQGSTRMAEMFMGEVLKRKAEIETTSLRPYMRTLLENIDDVFKQNDKTRIAEETLMYSSIVQNYCLKYL